MEDRRREEPRQFVERRRQRDWVTKAVPIFSVVGWVSAICTLLMLESARPKSEDLFSRMIGSPVRSYWNTTLLWVALGLLTLVFFACLFGFLFNAFRHKRKTDRFNKSIIILGIISLVSIGAFLLRFGSYL
ncbi:hypothetical protein LJC20_06705 [Eubacteriales bacterium OttesenSCG-928-M02]|nr:hypothetical protein [Eubacteriales bacterium OttesenSCG-928-M02]